VNLNNMANQAAGSAFVSATTPSSPTTSYYIRQASKGTGQSYQDLQALWKQCEQELNEESMFDPNMFKFFSKTKGDNAELINKKFKEKIANPNGEQIEDAVDKSNAIATDEFAADTMSAIEMPEEGEEELMGLPPIPNELNEEEPIEEAPLEEVPLNIEEQENELPTDTGAPAEVAPSSL
jgi:hypothetical protein